MRAGLPVVASDVGGVAELVEDGSTGSLVPRGDVEALAGRLGELLDSAELRLLLGKQVSNMPPANYGPSKPDHVLRFQTLLRKDSRVIVMGAVEDIHAQGGEI